MVSGLADGTLPMHMRKIAHERNQRLHTRGRHRIINRRAHAAEHTMAFQLHQTMLFRLAEEGLIQIFIAQAKDHVHF